MNHDNISKKLTIKFKRWAEVIRGNNQETILQQGEHAGLILPHSCLGGYCGSCKAKLISGEVQQEGTEGLTSDEISQGYILLCQSKALTNIEVSHE